MAYSKVRYLVKTKVGYDVIHMESDSSVILRSKNDAVDASRTVEQSLTALESAMDTVQGTLPNKMGLVVNHTEGNLLAVNTNGQAVDSGKKVSDFANSVHEHTIDQVTDLQTTLNSKAPLESPTFTGVPTVPTADANTDTTQIATTAFVQTAVNGLMDAKDAFRFIGKLNPNTSSTLPEAHAGHIYRVTADGTLSGLLVHAGDTATCCVDNTPANTPENWFITYTNHDGQVIGPTTAVANHVVVFEDSTGKSIKDSGYTIEASVPADAKFTDTVYTHPNAAGNTGNFGPVTDTSPKHGETFTVPNFTVDAQGHVSSAVNREVTLPSSPNISWSDSEPTDQVTDDIWMEAIP